MVGSTFSYLAFYGEPETGLSGTGSGGVFISEINLKLADGTVINSSNKDIYIDTINLVKSTRYVSAEEDPNFVMDDNFGYEFLTFNRTTPINAIYLYFEMLNPVIISGGDYWTRIDSSTTNSFSVGKLYGTNTDPSTLSSTDRLDISNYTFICDLTKNDYQP